MTAKAIAALLLLASASLSHAAPKPAYQLACIDAGARIAADDNRIQKYQRLIDVLTKRFKLTESQVGDKTYFVTAKLKKKGIKTSVIEMLEAMAALKEAVDLGMTFDETIVTLSMTMEANHKK